MARKPACEGAIQVRNDCKSFYFTYLYEWPFLGWPARGSGQVGGGVGPRCPWAYLRGPAGRRFWESKSLLFLSGGPQDQVGCVAGPFGTTSDIGETGTGEQVGKIIVGPALGGAAVGLSKAIFLQGDVERLDGGVLLCPPVAFGSAAVRVIGEKACFEVVFGGVAVSYAFDGWRRLGFEDELGLGFETGGDLA